MNVKVLWLDLQSISILLLEFRLEVSFSFFHIKISLPEMKVEVNLLLLCRPIVVFEYIYISAHYPICRLKYIS